MRAGQTRTGVEAAQLPAGGWTSGMEGVGVQTYCGMAMDGWVGWHVGGWRQAGGVVGSGGGTKSGLAFSGCYGYDDDDAMLTTTMTMVKMVTD